MRIKIRLLKQKNIDISGCNNKERNACLSLGRLYWKQKDFQSAKKYYEMSLVEYSGDNNLKGVEIIQRNKVKMYVSANLAHNVS